MDDSLLSGFLSAITSMPEMFGHTNESMQSVEMDYTKLLFSRTETNKIIVIGINKEIYEEEQNDQEIERLFSEISKLLDEKFDDVTWSNASKEDRYAFEHELVDRVLPTTLDVHEDYCQLGEDCTFNIETTKDETEYLHDGMTLWQRIETRIEHTRLSRLITFILKPIQGIFIWYEKRKYRKKRDKKMDQREAPS